MTIDGLYLKLDKKFILRADRLTIPANKKKQNLSALGSGLDRFNKILHYFKHIELKEVNFKNDHYSILYSDNIFYMVNDFFEIASHQISRDGDEIHAVMDLIYLREYDIRLSGKLVYNYKKDIALFSGSAEYMDIHADFMVSKKKKNLYYVIKSNSFSQFKSLVDQFRLPPKISLWITNRLKAVRYTLNRLKGAARIEKKSIKLIPDTIVGEAILEDVSINFKDGLNALKAESMKIVLKDENFYFELLKPYYGEKSLAGSSASILDLLNPKPVMLKLDLKFDTQLDSKVLEILKVYGIKLPLMQKSGSMDSSMKLDIDLRAKKTKYSCDFKLNEGDITIGNVVLPVVRGKVHVSNGAVTLSGIVLKDDSYQVTLSGNIDMKKKLANLDLNVKFLHLGEGEKVFLSMRNTKLPMTISYRNDTLIAFPSLKIKIKALKEDGSRVLKIADILILKKYLKNMPITIDGGHLNIRSKDFKQYQFDGLLKRNDCFIYEKDSSCMTQTKIDGLFSEKSFLLKAFQSRFVYDAEKLLITLKNLNFDLKKFLETYEDDNKTEIGKKMKVLGIHSILRYNKSNLLTDKYTLDIVPGGDFHFRGTLGKDFITVKKSKKDMHIKADRIGDKMLHPLINFSGLQKGRYSVEIRGIMGKLTKGVIKLEGGVMSDFKAYNNALALINTVPALATLSSPGFSSKGFKIKQGVIKFSIVNSRILTFDSILIEGKSATISGDGVINLETKKIDINIAIQAAKSMGKVVGSLPVLGYILTGENKSIMTFGLHVSGTLDEPTTETSTVKDILLLPFNMLRRTFNRPEK